MKNSICSFASQSQDAAAEVRTSKEKKLRSWGARALFPLYLYGLFRVIILKFRPVDLEFLRERLQLNLAHPEYMAARLRAGNLLPFHEISNTLYTMTDHGFTNLIGNIVIFIPLGLLLSSMAGERASRLFNVFWISFGLSLSLEVTQVIWTIGTFDVDDLLLNTLGGLLGGLLYGMRFRLYPMTPIKAEKQG